MQLPRVTPARPTQPRRPLSSAGAKPLAAASAPVAAKQPAKPSVKAGASDPLPTFKSSEEYKNYVINLVAQAQSAEQDLKAAQQALDEGKGSQSEVRSQRERLDAIKLQLAVLRDNFPIPKSWTRAKWLGGEGFNKDKFWKQQVEAIPGKEVIVTPKPEPQKETPQPAPEPSTAQPASPSENGLSSSMVTLLNQYASEGLSYSNTSSNRYAMLAQLEATLKITEVSTDETSRRIAAFIKGTIKSHKSGQYTSDYDAYQSAFLAIQAMASPTGSVDDRAQLAIRAIADKGLDPSNTSSNRYGMNARLDTIQAIANGSADPDLSAAARFVSASHKEFPSGQYTSDYYAYRSVFKGLGALLQPEGTMTERTKKAIAAIADEGLDMTNTSSNRYAMYAQVDVIKQFTVGSDDVGLQAINTMSTNTVKENSGQYTSDYVALKSVLQASKALTV